jgi:2-dehydro-3-deoxy-D-arabinonate dehydratase
VFIVRYARPEQPAAVGVAPAELSGPVHPITEVASVAELLTQPLARVRELTDTATQRPAESGQVTLLPPVDGRTEVWASGVTYLRSRDARVEESSQKDVYQKVYEADRPELFFKSVAWRVLTDGEPIGLRADSALNVPEPELAAVANADAEIIGYLVCNDVSSRTIEGENPLYLPQAKVYAGACAISAGIRAAWTVEHADALEITLTITRDGTTVFSGDTSTDQMRRGYPDLVDWLYRGDHYPHGVVLSTGTGIIPGMEFSLQAGDEVRIDIDQVGSLTNPVVVGTEPFGRLGHDDAATSRRAIHV